MSFDNLKADYDRRINEKDGFIEGLEKKLRETKADVEFHKQKYAQVCGESTYLGKRKELGIPNNVLRLPIVDKSALDIDLSKHFMNILGNANQVDTTTSDSLAKQVQTKVGESQITDEMLILMVGLPLSGKSTLARKYVDYTKEFVVVCPDEIRLAVHGERFDADQEDSVWATAKAAVNKLLSEGSRVIVDATNLTKKERKIWSGVAREFGVKPALLLVNTSPEVCRSRNKQLNRINAAKLDRIIKKFKEPTQDEGKIYTAEEIERVLELDKH